MLSKWTKVEGRLVYRSPGKRVGHITTLIWYGNVSMGSGAYTGKLIATLAGAQTKHPFDSLVAAMAFVETSVALEQGEPRE